MSFQMILEFFMGGFDLYIYYSKHCNRHQCPTNSQNVLSLIENRERNDDGEKIVKKNL